MTNFQLFPNENKFAKNCEFNWPYSLENAEFILETCFYYSNLYELVSNESNEETSLLEEDIVQKLCPKIKHWKYENIVCSALFFKITNIVQKNEEISDIYWSFWIPILVDRNLGQEFREFIERNKLFELYSTQIIKGFKLALDLHSIGTFSFRNITKDDLTRVLKVLKIPKIKIKELTEWSFENKSWSQLNSFLENYTSDVSF